MTSGFYSYRRGLDLDSVFHSGNAAFDAGYNVAGGQNLGNRYAPLADGDQAGQTDFTRNGTDLNAYFAALGTVFPVWPIGGGFFLENTGLSVSNGIAPVFAGKMSWSRNQSADAAISNLVAFSGQPCPGIAYQNASAYSDVGSFVRANRYNLPLGAVIRLSFTCLGIGGATTADITVNSTPNTGWVGAYSGPINQCVNNGLATDSLNVIGFGPGTGTFYSSFVGNLSWTKANSWNLNFSYGFSCNNANPGFNSARLTVTRVA